MSHHDKVPNHPFCKNCYYPTAALDKHCPLCGQKPTTGRVTLHDLLHELIHSTLHLDGRFFLTLKDLFTPGKLTKEFFLGHHARYAHPVPMVLVLGGFFFLVAGLMTHKLEEKIQRSTRDQQKKYHKQEFLLEIDSIQKVVAAKTNNIAGQKALLTLVDRCKTEFKLDGQRADSISQKKKEDDKKAKKNKKSQGDKDGDDIATQIKKEIDENGDKEDAGDYDQKQKASLEKNKRDGVNKPKVKNGITFTSNEQKNLSADSITVGGFSMGSNKFDLVVSLKDLNNLSAEKIVEKYNVHGFWTKLITKQSIKFKQDAGGFLHNFIKAISVMMLLLLPVLALMLRLLYRKKWYYVEHLIFMTHFHCSWFLIGGMALAISHYAPERPSPLYWLSGISTSSIFLFGLPLFLFLSIKRYYKQGWVKTFIKMNILGLGYFICSIIFLIFTGLYAAATY
jgi:hypothetical protein